MNICKKLIVKDIVFFGCGAIGKELLDNWTQHGIVPEFFSDNNMKLWGENINGVRVISPQELVSRESAQIIITTQYKESVKEGLIKIGVEDKRIVENGYLLYAENLNQIAKSFWFDCEEDDTKECKSVMLDLSCGMVLGGVEQWCFQTAHIWSRMQYVGEYLVPFMEPVTIHDDTFQTTMLGDMEIDKDSKMAVFKAALDKFIKQRNSIVLCNFPFEIFQAACFAKRCGNADIRIVAVIHNDEELYYRTYGIWQNEIDCCIVISERMKQKAIMSGISEDKIKLMRWFMSFPEMERKYSGNDEPLRIGYAGRITYIQKRVDLLKEVVLKLRERNIRFLLKIAGSGDYEKELHEWIEKDGDADVIYCGMIPHEGIYDYWNQQDVYISVSEWEGHSISQVEAMAMGAVPVVTNTSGTEDDITDGESGFIVNIGDIDSLVDRLEQLYLDKGYLLKMGDMARKTIREKCDEKQAEVFWSQFAPHKRFGMSSKKAGNEINDQ